MRLEPAAVSPRPRWATGAGVFPTRLTMLLKLLQAVGFAKPLPGGIMPLIQRSPKWNAVRKAHLEKHKTCEVCGGDDNVEVHHVLPVHLYPELELDVTNLLSLCNGAGGGCHLRMGHLGSWKAFNPSIRQDAKWWLNKIRWRRMKRYSIDGKPPPGSPPLP